MSSIANKIEDCMDKEKFFLYIIVATIPFVYGILGFLGLKVPMGRQGLIVLSQEESMFYFIFGLILYAFIYFYYRLTKDI